MPGKVFINYRRDDDPGAVQALFARLEPALTAGNLFMDVDNIEPGLDFVEVLNEQVAQCDVFLAVVGPKWLEARDSKGRRRLDDANDFVRVEIESALRQGKRVIPVLVNDAQMPRLDDLPESLWKFARCNAVRLTHQRFSSDTQSLVKSIKDAIERAAQVRAAATKLMRGSQGDMARAARASALAEIERDSKSTKTFQEDVANSATPQDSKPSRLWILRVIIALVGVGIVGSIVVLRDFSLSYDIQAWLRRIF